MIYPIGFQHLIDRYGSPVNDLVDGIPKDCSISRLKSYKSIVFGRRDGVSIRNGLDLK